MPESTDEQDLVKALNDVSLTLNTPASSGSTAQGSAGAVASPFSASITPDPAPVAATPSVIAPIHGGDSPLDSIKKDALLELRPLVDKLNIDQEEKFDTYLLLIRSTDDASLIAPAHEAAKAITDETRRAQALLDVIKEIDFLTQKAQ